MHRHLSPFFAACLATVLIAGCKSSSKSSSDPAPQTNDTAPTNAGANSTDPRIKPCETFTATHAATLGDTSGGDVKNEGGTGTVGLCQRGKSYAFARFEKMGKSSFEEIYCKVDRASYLSGGPGEVNCRLGTEAPVSVAAYAKGYSIQVGNATEEACKAALTQIIATLPAE